MSEPKLSKSKRARISIPATKTLIDQINAYPHAAQIDPGLWESMSVPQQCMYLLMKQLREVLEPRENN